MSGNLTVDKVRKAPTDTLTDLVRGLSKTWMNLNGTGTIAIRDSLNVSSVVDNGTGNYTANMTAAMSAVDYHATVGNGYGSSGGEAYATIANWASATVSAFRATHWTGAFSSLVDNAYSVLEIQGDLA